MIMNYWVSAFVLLSVALIPAFGCSSEREGNHEGHDHASGESHSDHDCNEHLDHEHSGGGTALGPITIGETTLEVTVGGEPHPNETLHVDLLHTSGPLPSSVRVWFGDQSGVGSMKGKGIGSNGKYHADAEVPDPVTATMQLWVEVENDGDRSAGSLTVELGK